MLEKDECEKLGMGLFLGVSEASAEPPKFIHLTYTPKGGCSWAAVGGWVGGQASEGALANRPATEDTAVARQVSPAT